jgi:L-malate glycosyltransferase
MKIAVCGPVSVHQLSSHLARGSMPVEEVPTTTGNPSVTHLVQGLLASGHEIVVVALDSSVKSDIRLTGEQLTLRVCSSRSQHRARDVFKVERAAIRAALIDEGPDVVNAQWTYEYALGAIASGIPTVVTVRDWAPLILRWHPHPYRLVRLGMNRRTLSSAQQLTTVSPQMAARLSKAVGRDIPVIPNALPDGQIERTRREPDLDQPTIIAVNNGFSRFKNVASLLRAFPKVRSEIGGATLELIGQEFGPGGRAERWAKDEGLAEGIAFRGAISPSEIDSAIGHSDLLVHPSLEESFGMVLIEAMARGVPVVGGRSSGAVPWVLDYGAAGVLTDVRRPDDLADSIVALLQSRERWLSLSCAGHHRVQEHFRLSEVTDAYLQVYERLLARFAA